MDTTPRIALVGAGGWGSNHLRVWQELGVLQCVCDTSETRLAKLRETHPGLALTSSFDDVLEANIDAVVIATPAPTHGSLALRALQAGLDVLVEKPMALTVTEADRMVQATQEHKRILMVGHVLAYHPAFVALKGLITSGELGRVRYLYSNRLNMGRIRTEENALWSFAPHDIAMILDIAGHTPGSVGCSGEGYLTDGVADVTLSRLQFAGKLQAHVFVSWLHPFREQRFVVVGEQNMAVFDDTRPWEEKLQLFRHRINWVEGRVPIAERAGGECVPLEPKEPLKEECLAFLEAIKTRKQPRTDAEHGREVMRVMAALQHAMEQGGSTVDLARGAGQYVHPSATIDPGAVLSEGVKVWHYTHVMPDARIGAGTSLGQNVFVGRAVTVGRGVKVQNNVSIYEGVDIEDHVFCGPSVVFTNVHNPRSEVERKAEYRRTRIGRGASLGANATIVCGVRIGDYAFVGAGAVVTKDVPAHALVQGVPARQVGWMCACGEKLDIASGDTRCKSCGRRYAKQANETGLSPLS